MTCSSSSIDLVGGPFSVIESDPGVFTSLTRRLGVKGLELIELYDIEPWAVEHLHPYGLILCFLWRKDSHRPTDFNDPGAERVWFANQLSDDACATHAILNVLMNCPSIELGAELRALRQDTERMSPVMRGLAVTNSPVIRPAHNSFARPSDIRASLNQLAITTFDEEKRKAKQRKEDADGAKPPPAKRAKTTKAAAKSRTSGRSKGKAKQDDTDEATESDNEKEKEDKETEEEETYHFIGYVPAYGKVWELDGLKSGPLEVGELPIPDASTSRSDPRPNAGWMDVVRPALRMKMEKYGGSGNDGSNIRFSLLAIVDDMYQKASDELELLKREKIALERRMEPEWQTQVAPSVLETAQYAFTLQNGPSGPEPGKTYAADFGARKMERDVAILELPPAELAPAWEACIQRAVPAKVAVEDELSKAIRSNADHLKRTFDYEPLIREYITRLQDEGLLNALLDRDNYGRKKRGAKPKTKA